MAYDSEPADTRTDSGSGGDGFYRVHEDIKTENDGEDGFFRTSEDDQDD